MNMNKIYYAGHLTGGVEMKTTAGGITIAKFTVAENYTYIDKGEKKTKPCFILFTAFGRVAENCGKYLHKGSPVFVEAHFDLNTWIDEKTQEKKSRMNYIADYVHFLESKPVAAEVSGKDAAAGERKKDDEPDEGLE